MDVRTDRAWSDEQFLRPLYEINERCIDLLVQLAARPATESPPVALVQGIRAELRTLDPAARRRAAQCPFLLVDLEFRDPEWWQHAKRHACTHATSSQRRGNLPRKVALPLARATLVLAWHTVRSDPEASRVSLGLAPRVTQAISLLSLDEIDRLAERQFHRLRPRWHDRPGAWRALLRAARGTEESAIRDFRLHGIQLLGSELLPHCP